MMRLAAIAFVIVLAFWPTYSPAPTAIPAIEIEPAFPKLIFQRPLWVGGAGDGRDRLFVVEQDGRIQVFRNRAEMDRAKVFLDIRAKVRRAHNEEGLLGLAFHPRHRENRRLFIYYSASEPRRSVLSEILAAGDDPDRADPSSERVLLEVEQPWGNHNGGALCFGPDGKLYLGLGDGGAAADPRGHGQNLKTLLGSILRLDVDARTGELPYGIPADNPFTDRKDARGEIWAYGLRNVWRMSFDRQGGDLWAGDVGQDDWEEIDLIRKGGNYGWNLREGKHAFEGRTGVPGLLDPVVELPRAQARSITGGQVYRGKRHPDLAGVYIFADYATGYFWGLRYDARRETLLGFKELGRHPQLQVSSFGEDDQGEVYLTSFGDGRVHRVVPVGR